MRGRVCVFLPPPFLLLLLLSRDRCNPDCKDIFDLISAAFMIRVPGCYEWEV